MNLIDATALALQNKLTEQTIKVYHGTNNIFNDFNNIKNGIGYWFSTDKDYASEHGNHLLNITLNLDNILDIEIDEDKFWKFVNKFFGKDVDEQTIFSSNEFGKFLNSNGYDAICWTHNDGTTYVVFDPENIKIDKLDEEFVDADEVFDKIDVYKICMDTYTGKRLYLAQTNMNVKHWKEAKTYEWVFDPNIAMQFNWEKEAEEFAQKYFKNFRGWYIRKEYTYA